MEQFEKLAKKFNMTFNIYEDIWYRRRFSIRGDVFEIYVEEEDNMYYVDYSFVQSKDTQYCWRSLTQEQALEIAKELCRYDSKISKFFKDITTKLHYYSC